MKKQTVVQSSELLHFAEEHLGISWNECRDIFYQGHETLCSPESSNKLIELEEVCGYLDFIKTEYDSLKYKPHANDIQTHEILKAFMLANNLSEMLVVSGK